MHTLYDLGYNDLREAGLLAEITAKLGAVVFDIRHAPTSRNAQWRKAALENRLGAAYRHIAALGNLNYKGGLVAIVDLIAGLEEIEHALKEHPVILMCACWDREICHRRVVAEAFTQRSGVQVVAITRQAEKGEG